MWRVKNLNQSLSPSPQPGKPAMRTPLRELTLQPGTLNNSGEVFPVCSSLTPSLSKLGLQESSNTSSPLDFVNARRSDSPSEQFSYHWQQFTACQYESDEQLQTIFVSQTSEETIESMDNNVVQTLVLESPPLGQQQEITSEAHSDVGTETSRISLDEPMRPEDVGNKKVAPSIEVVAAEPEKPTFQDTPLCLEQPPDLCSEQQLHCSRKSLGDRKTESVPEDLAPSESNDLLPSSMLCLTPSPALEADFPGERESFPTLPNVIKQEGEVLASNMENVPSTCLTPNLVEMESQGVPGAAVEDAGRILGSDSETWMSPLAWLEKDINTSVMLENLRQSLSLPSVLPDAGIALPFSTCSVGSWLTPPAPQEKSTNKPQADPVGTKNSTSETQHPPWSCPPDLTALSRHDLEDNLLSSLVLLKLLYHQLQAWKNQLSVPHLEVQDNSTQTDTAPSEVTEKPQHLQESQQIGQALQQARSVMQSWMLACKELTSLFHLSLLHLEEVKITVNQESQRAETLVSCCSDMLKKLRAKLQSLSAEKEEAKHGEEMALRGKDAAEAVLEAFCAHSSQRISQLQYDLTSMQEFQGLLKQAQAQLVELQTEQEEVVQQTVNLTSTLQQDWLSMQLDYTTWTALLSRCHQLTEKLAVKSRQALQQRDAAIEEKQQVSRELEQVSARLEHCKGQVEQLELENSRLATDLRAQLQILASVDSQLKELQSQHAHCAQVLATKDELLSHLTQSKEEQVAQWQKEEEALKLTQAELQQQQAVLAKEVQDLKETLEFADQENQVAHLELGQVECQLKATLEVLRERSLQCETLKDAVENLKANLANTIAENQEQDLEKTRQYSQELGVITEQLQKLTFFLQTKLKQEAEPETLLLSTAWTPTQGHALPNDSTLSASILTAVTDEDPESAPVPLVGSETSAFTRVVSLVSLQPTETPSMETSLAEMSTVILKLENLCSQVQESKEEAISTLQQKIYDLQARLQAQEEQHQEAQKAKEADIEKLNQALCLRYKNEKELEEVIQKQNEKILEQIDKSGELISLREEVTQLTRSLRRAETETKVLQETLAGQMDSNCQPMDTNWIQEKVWLSQEVDKLRVMFLEMKNEKAKLVVKFQGHRSILEENLRRSDKELKKLDDIVQHIYETLLSIPEVVKGCKELQGLLEFLS
ncbi:sperm-associated antigen 5 [Ochotona princeps]|uniref:sperm-associated antigen 5 n=1 Tax=Ochotona princeps TaxID=9978 RepID=UPI0027151652|nr:sperm-associated antigen 5 [Ochotona princeps]